MKILLYDLPKFTTLLCFLQLCQSADATLLYPYEETWSNEPLPTGGEFPVHMLSQMPSWLLLEALLFLIPNIAWQLFARRLGCPLSIICSRVQDLLSFASQEVTNNAVKDATTLISGYCTRNARSRKSSNVFFWCYGNLLCVGYLCLMVIHIVNVIAQFFVLSSLLEMPYCKYGFESLAIRLQAGMITSELEKSILDRYSPDKIYFPKDLVCAFKVRHHRRVHRYNVQCTFPMSDFHASLLLFIWLFLFVVIGVTAVKTGIFLWEFFFRSRIGPDVIIYDGKRGIDGRYPIRGGHHQATLKMTEFRSSFLGRDGLFILYTIFENAGSVIADRVYTELWRSYQGDQSDRRWQTEQCATRETTVYSDVMAGIRQQENPRGSQAADTTSEIGGGQHTELVPMLATSEL